MERAFSHAVLIVWNSIIRAYFQMVESDLLVVAEINSNTLPRYWGSVFGSTVLNGPLSFEIRIMSFLTL